MTVKQLKFMQPWKELVEWASLWDYGSFHDHEEISEILTLQPGSPRYYSQIQKANEILQAEHQKHLKNHQGQGYEVLRPNQHVSESARIQRLAKRKADKAFKVAACTNKSKLTAGENKQLSDYLARAAKVKLMLEKESQSFSLLAGKTTVSKTLPRPKVIEDETQ